MFCCPSSRLTVIVNGENPPAWMLVVPAVSDGLNGSVVPGHGPPLGPLVTSKLEELSTGRGTRPRRERRLGGV